MKDLKPMLASYARSFLAASLACYMAGVTDPKAIASAGIAAILPVLMRWLNPADKVYGRK
jgi:uncharacterized membrane protein YgaE (UPF0421/DUF939 family)